MWNPGQTESGEAPSIRAHLRLNKHFFEHGASVPISFLEATFLLVNIKDQERVVTADHMLGLWEGNCLHVNAEKAIGNTTFFKTLSIVNVLKTQRFYEYIYNWQRMDSEQELFDNHDITATECIAGAGHLHARTHTSTMKTIRKRYV